jgi:hypothetical protein
MTIYNPDSNSTKLNIELIYQSTLEKQPSKFVTKTEIDLTDRDVHAWFFIFSKILNQAGFSDYTIMAGAAQVAFNEWNRPEDMRKLAKECDLMLLEDIEPKD